MARNTLQYNTLVADHDGLITSENADTGQVVSAGQAVYGLAWNGDTDVILDAAESDLGRISVGQAAKVTFPALPGRQFEAHVREIAPAADPQSRTYRVKLTMTGHPESVRFGMTGDATLAPVTSGAARGAATHLHPAGYRDFPPGQPAGRLGDRGRWIDAAVATGEGEQLHRPHNRHHRGFERWRCRCAGGCAHGLRGAACEACKAVV